MLKQRQKGSRYHCLQAGKVGVNLQSCFVSTRFARDSKPWICAILSFTDAPSPDMAVVGVLRADDIKVASSRREATVERILVLSVVMPEWMG